MKELKKVQKTLDRVFGYLNNQDLGEHGKSLLAEVGDAHRIVENLIINGVGNLLKEKQELSFEDWKTVNKEVLNNYIRITGSKISAELHLYGKYKEEYLQNL